jgi:mannose-6-phosphate isomerase-like protein (cupin superfamily)
VLSGSAKWYVNGELVNSKPGEFIHHPPRATHQMITENQPILALWMRTGELEGNYWFVKKKASQITRS